MTTEVISEIYNSLINQAGTCQSLVYVVYPFCVAADLLWNFSFSFIFVSETYSISARDLTGILSK